MTDLSHDCPCCGGRIEHENVWDECNNCGATYTERANQ